MGWTSEWLSRFLQRRPAALRALIRLSELVRPPGPIIGRASEVRDIFDRTHDFQVGITIAPKTKTGSFLLSMDEGPRHSRELRAIRKAITGPFAHFEQIAERESEALANQLAATLVHGERIDLSSDYAERVFVRTLEAYFGLTAGQWTSDHLDVEDGERTLALYIRYLGATIGSGDSPAPFGLEALAQGIAEDFKTQLGAAIEAKRSEPRDETVLGHLLHPAPGDEADAQYLEQDGLSRSIAGLLAAGASFPKAFANVLFELAERGRLKELVEKAHDASCTKDAWKAGVEAYVLEALRFRPAFPLLVRYCPRSVQLAGREITAGSTITFSPLAAMFDPALFERPEEFIPGRPAENYLVFGAAPRACIGKWMMLGLFPPLLRALFVQVPQIASAPPGKFHYDAVALEHYWVTLKQREAKLEYLPQSEEPRERRVTPLAAAAAAAEPSVDLPHAAAEEASVDVRVPSQVPPAILAHPDIPPRDSRPA